MSNDSKILIVDADPVIGEMVKHWFRNLSMRVSVVDSIGSATSLIESNRYHLVLVAYESLEGLGTIKEIGKIRGNLPVVVSAESYSSDLAIEVVKAGAFDFLPKPFREEEVHRVFDEAIQSCRNSGQTVDVGHSLTADDKDAMVGQSRAMLEVYKSLGRLSAAPVTVLIHGETGTGKELVARALYQYGHRSHLPFITINCAAIPETLLESELFGHEKGSFTGATRTRIGKFEQAHNSTLFLDEIGDMDLNLQSKLLRVLQEKRFQRVGGNEEIAVDVRIIAATHRDLGKMVDEGDFREDLYYRLNVAKIELPALRDRDGDISLLAHYFLRRFHQDTGLPEVGITPSAVARLESGSWPGNVRQLQNVIRKAALSSRGYPIDEANIAILMEDQTRGSSDGVDATMERILELNPKEAYHAFLDEFESRFLALIMRKTGNNLSRAAEWLGMSRFTLREKLKAYELRD